MKVGKYIIYGLVDPDLQVLRYIGKSCSGLARAVRHTSPSELIKDNTYKGRWLRKLNKRPEIIVIQDFGVDPSILADAEQFWIKYYKSLGYPLTNLTEGGEGCVGRVCSEETKKKIGDAQRNKPRPFYSEEARVRARSYYKGKQSYNKGVYKNDRFSDQFGNIYTMEEFCSKFNVKYGSVNQMLSGKRKTICKLKLKVVRD